MTRVFIVAPTPVLRAGLRMLLNDPNFQVVGDAPELNPAAPEAGRAEVIIAAGQNLPEDLAEFVGTNPAGLGLVALSENEALVPTLQALPLHGWAVLPLEVPAAQLQATVNAVSLGLVVLPDALVKGLRGQRLPTEIADNRVPDEPLTPREHEVLELLSQGLSNKLIARRLQISEHTVKFHVSSLYTKLDASSRAEAVSRGARLGLISF